MATSPTQARPVSSIVPELDLQGDTNFSLIAAIRQGLALWHLTSLDAPTVAVVWALAFARGARVHLPLWVPIGLALCAWSVYIVDRLLDAYRAIRSTNAGSVASGLQLKCGRGSKLDISVNALRPRHFFHWRHRHVLLPVAASAALIAIGMLVRFMPMAARERNSVLAIAALAYFTSVHIPWQVARPSFKLPKELLVAILFTTACVIPTWVRIPLDDRVRLILGPAFLVFVLLAWLNCKAIDVWESGSPSLSISRPAIALGLSSLILAAVTYALHSPRIAVLFGACALGAILTAMLDRNSRNISPTMLRAAADLVLLTPALLLIAL